MSAYAEANSQLYESMGAESINSVWALTYERSRGARYFAGLLAFVKILLGRDVPGMESVRESTLIFSAGGGYLFSSRRGALGAGFLNSLFHIWAATHSKKPTCIFPKSIGPINFRIDRFLLRTVLKRVNLIFVRESLSLEYLKSLGLDNMALCPDIAFSLHPEPNDVSNELSSLTTQGAPKIGLTVLDWQFFRKSTTPPDVDAYLANVVAACKRIKEEFPQAHFYVFVQVAVATGLGAESDMPISERLHQELGESATLIPLDPERGADTAIAMYSDMDIFIASRMHSAIFALCAHVPTLALVYQPKTLGTFNLLGLSEYTRDVQDIDSDLLSTQACAMLNNKEQLRVETARKMDDVQRTIDALMTSHVKPLLSEQSQSQ